MKRVLTLALAVCLVYTLGTPVIAIEGEEPAGVTVPTVVDQTVYRDTVQVVVNDAVIAMNAPVLVENGVSYVPYWPVIQALYPDAAAEWRSDRVVITAPGLTLELSTNWCYLIANGRYLYLSSGIRYYGSSTLLPVRTLCAALGADVAWDPIGNNVVITAGTGPIAPADEAYDADTLYWLSHIINAESGNQPLAGKIAVGNVVLNRVASTQFPDTVYEVVFQRHQFTPVSNGTINLTPNEESVIAAKLCLDGANTVGNALYFLNPRTSGNSWAARTRTYVTTIGQHAFYF